MFNAMTATERDVSYREILCEFSWPHRIPIKTSVAETMSMTVFVHCMHVIELHPNFLRGAYSPHSKETSLYIPVLEAAASPGGVVRCASARRR